MNLLGTALGWIMRLIYSVVKSYGLTILIISILAKLCTLPSTYKQQVNQARMGLLSKKLEHIRKSYASNPTRMQEEQTKLFSEEGINQTAGCLGTFLTLFLLTGVYSVVMRPLTYILGLGDMMDKAKGLLETWLNAQGIVEKSLSSRPELIILQYAKSNPDIFVTLEGFNEKIAGFQNNFLGFDLGGQPTIHPDSWTAGTFMLALMPVLAFLLQILLTFISQRHSKKMNPSSAAAPGMGGMNLMLYAMPVMTLWLGYSFPAGVNFYWIVNSALSILMSVGIYKYLSPERVKVINEKEKEKQLAKGPTWMQRVMEASQQMEREQQNVGGNRTVYSDIDDGMSRKERAEYDRKIIEAARRRTALKYGEEITDVEDFTEVNDED